MSKELQNIESESLNMLLKELNDFFIIQLHVNDIRSSKSMHRLDEVIQIIETKIKDAKAIEANLDKILTILNTNFYVYLNKYPKYLNSFKPNLSRISNHKKYIFDALYEGGFLSSFLREKQSLDSINIFYSNIVELIRESSALWNELKLINKILDKLQEQEKISADFDPEKVFNIHTEYYWHAGITGKNGEIIDSIIEAGLLPKIKVYQKTKDFNIGSPFTPVANNGVYLTNHGISALNFLKSANNYQWSKGGLPFVVCVEINEYTKQNNVDSDILAATPQSRAIVWFALIQTYIDLEGSMNRFLSQKDEFIDRWYSSWKIIAEELEKSGRIKEFEHDKKKLLSFLSYVVEDKDLYFVDEDLYTKVRSSHTDEFWGRFIINMHQMKSDDKKDIRNNLHQNMYKTNGYDPSFIKQIFVITPGGDADWRRWADIMKPVDIKEWDNWTNLGYPGNGKLISIYKKSLFGLIKRAA